MQVQDANVGFVENDL